MKFLKGMAAVLMMAALFACGGAVRSAPEQEEPIPEVPGDTGPEAPETPVVDPPVVDQPPVDPPVVDPPPGGDPETPPPDGGDEPPSGGNPPPPGGVIDPEPKVLPAIIPHVTLSAPSRVVVGAQVTLTLRITNLENGHVVDSVYVDDSYRTNLQSRLSRTKRVGYNDLSDDVFDFRNYTPELVHYDPESYAYCWQPPSVDWTPLSGVRPPPKPSDDALTDMRPFTCANTPSTAIVTYRVPPADRPRDVSGSRTLRFWIEDSETGSWTASGDHTIGVTQ